MKQTSKITKLSKYLISSFKKNIEVFLLVLISPMQWSNVITLPIDYRVNCYDATMPQTPFGGFKQSGQGREL